MAHTYDTDLVDAQQAALTSKRAGIVNGDDFGGVLQVIQATYTLLGTEVSGQTIQVCPNLPIGSVIVPSLCAVNCEDPGTTLTGTPYVYNGTTQGDALSTALTLSSGGIVVFANASGALTPSTDRMVSGDHVAFYIASVGSLTSGKKLQFILGIRGKA